MKRKTIYILVLAALLVGAFFVWRNMSRSSDTGTQTEFVSVTRGPVAQVVNATGNVAPAGRATLTFESPGRVAEVLGEEGDSVRKDQSLARLDTTDLELALRSAEISLRSAQARYDQVKAGPAQEDIAAAEASLASALASYDKLKTGPTPDESAAAKANVERTQVLLQQAQAAYDRISWMGGAEAMPQALQLQQATIDHQTALANYRLATSGATESALKGAEAQIAQAHASLERLKRTPTAEDLAIAQAQLDSAQVVVDQAKRRLDSAMLRSTLDGVVERVSITAGQLVSAGVPALVVADYSAFHIMVIVDEIDVALVQPDQRVKVVLDALPGVEIQGHVDHVGLAASQTTGVVSYDVKIAIDSRDAVLRVGMSATIDIIVAEKESALLLTNRAIRADRQTGQRYVEVQRNGQTVRVDITTGLRDERNTEILAGLSEGDQVIITTVTSGQALRGLFMQ
jgi:HlyD family secretion protein